MDLELSGKTALVTGSSRGTGEGIAKVLAREGARVFVHGMKPGDGLDDANRVANEIQRAGGRADAVIGDLTTDDGAEQVAAAVGEADILVNNYGAAERGFWLDPATGAEAWISVYQKNVLSAARMIRLLAPAMKKRGWGRIIQLGTIGSTQPNARMPHYYASKGALANLTVSLMLELAGTGVTVNTISPGLIRTREVEEMYRRRAQKNGWGDDWEVIERHIMEEFGNPSGRIARTGEVGDLVAFIASTRSAMINGMNIRIDGGGMRIVN
ncbi:MAG: SDR family NAD(P)-dependent oxidoreductase [Pseudomonadota bacterium]|jgi:3-oxoacyl-[acyl-carrier protein] reductase|nr:3-oxoacyl-ACP reductase [Alphaproteobacteria bacterium]